MYKSLIDILKKRIKSNMIKEVKTDFSKIQKPYLETEIETRFRQYYASLHIRAAALFSRLTYKIEQNCDKGFNQEEYIEHRSFVTNAIFSSTAFLEAYINELYSDLCDIESRNYNQKYSAEPFNIFSFSARTKAT